MVYVLIAVIGAFLIGGYFLARKSTKPPSVTQPPVPAPVAQIPQPVPPVVTAPPPVFVNRLPKYFGYWLENTQRTLDHTNFITVGFWQTDAERESFTAIMDQAVRDGRKIIMWTPFYTYGPTPRSRNGYSFASDGIDKWNAALGILNLYKDSIIAFWLMDEPNSAAWGDCAGGPGVNYDPNLYNDILQKGIDTIKSTLPWAKVALNYSDIDDRLVIPNGLDIIGIECYDGESSSTTKVSKLKAKTKLPIWMLLRAYRDGDADISDAQAAADAVGLFEYSMHDEQIDGLYPFRYCIDQDANCGDDSKFYTVGGNTLPSTKAALITIGKKVTGKA